MGENRKILPRGRGEAGLSQAPEAAACVQGWGRRTGLSVRLGWAFRIGGAGR